MTSWLINHIIGPGVALICATTVVIVIISGVVGVVGFIFKILERDNE